MVRFFLDSLHPEITFERCATAVLIGLDIPASAELWQSLL